MTIWTAFVLIAAIVAVAMLVGARLNARPGPSAEARDDQREQELQAEIARLRERVEVLERIATDSHEAKRLSEDIDRLRDRD